MAQIGTKNGKYAVQGIETLRAKINREFIIRLQNPYHIDPQRLM